MAVTEGLAVAAQDSQYSDCKLCGFGIRNKRMTPAMMSTEKIKGIRIGDTERESRKTDISSLSNMLVMIVAALLGYLSPTLQLTH